MPVIYKCSHVKYSAQELSGPNGFKLHLAKRFTMQAEDIINAALNSGGKMIGGPDLFILEGNSERNEFRILMADECFRNNITAFTYNIRTGYLMLGMYSSRETAEEQIGVIRQLFRDEDGNVLL